MATTTVIASTTTNLHDHSMASRRPALANIPNAINSPLRGNVVAGKRTRDTQNAPLHEQPPIKRQAIEIRHDDGENVDPFMRRPQVDGVDERSRKVTSSVVHPSAFEKRLTASREKKDVSAASRHHSEEKRTHSREQQVKLKELDLENLKQWQRHYRKQFPMFVFYFDSVSEDARLKSLRQMISLGAREEKFFSRAVTHVVTTRQVPAVAPSTKEDMAQQQSKETQTNANVRKTTNMLDSTLQRRAQSFQPPTRTPDVLTRARELNIKIWTYEKLQRVLKSMLDTETGEPMHDIKTVPQQSLHKQPTRAKDVDLEQLLRNEKINGPADRDMTVTGQDMCQFKGCYIYIHDMDERNKPTMVRDYPKPASKEDGKWPQFRLSAVGRCPFIEDPTQTKQQQELERRQAKADRERIRRTRAATETTQHPLVERDTNLRRSPRKLNQEGVDLAKPLDPPKLVPAKRQSSNDAAPAVFGSTQINLRGLPRMIGGVPIASGMQHSNVTSAIKSAAISSAAISSTAPGMTRRVTDSKEVSTLKRKVLERGASATSQHPSSYMNDVRAAINEEPGPPARAAKRKAQESILGAVPEEAEVNIVSKQRKERAKKAKTEKDAKPGYCENCRDKFDDFEEHCNSRKHMKFARTADNWKELDDLLALLRRPRKQT